MPPARADRTDEPRELQRGAAVVGRAGTELSPGRVIEIGAYSPGEEEAGGFDDVVISPEPVAASVSARDSDDVVVFRPGMTMEDLERQAIAAALSSVNGNRRKAAELLDIGERTLYRKISKYELDD